MPMLIILCEIVIILKRSGFIWILPASAVRILHCLLHCFSANQLFNYIYSALKKMDSAN